MKEKERKTEKAANIKEIKSATDITRVPETRNCVVNIPFCDISTYEQWSLMAKDPSSVFNNPQEIHLTVLFVLCCSTSRELVPW